MNSRGYESYVRQFAARLRPARAAQLNRFLQRSAHGAANQPKADDANLLKAELNRLLLPPTIGPLENPRYDLPRSPDDPLLHEPISGGRAQEHAESARIVEDGESQRFREQVEIKTAVAELYGEDDGPAYDPTPKNKTFTRVNPSYNKQRNVLGSTVSVLPGGPSLPVAWFQCDEEDATVFSTTAYVIPTYVATDQLRPYVKVTYGTRVSQLATITVDVSLGCQFSLCGAAAFVEVGADAGANGIANPYPITAFVGWNTTQRQSPSPRTVYIDSLGAAANKIFNIPAFAMTVSNFQRSDTTAPITLDFIDTSGTTAFTYIIAANAFFGIPVQISGDVVKIRVTNGGASTIQARLVFGLSL